MCPGDFLHALAAGPFDASANPGGASFEKVAKVHSR